MATTTLPPILEEPTSPPEPKPTRALLSSRDQIRNALLYSVLIGYSIFSLGPFIFAFISSFKRNSEILQTPPTLVPDPATSLAYQTILNGSSNFGHYIFNSFSYAILTAAFNVLLCSLAGYAFGRMEFWGKNVLFALTLAVLMIPLQLIIIPKFLIATSLGLTNNLAALVIPNMVQPASVFIMTQFMKTLPRELEESAVIDGASRLRTFFQIILPLTRPALVTVALFTFQGAWNDFLWPLVVISDPTKYTLTVGLTFFKGIHFTEYNLLLAGAAINIIPLVILFFVFQRYFIRGAATAGLAGR